MPADEVTHGTDVDESRVRTGPRHAAPKKPLFTRFHMPAGKTIASIAMPTAVIVGMGFTSTLALAAGNDSSPSASKSLTADEYKDCVTALDGSKDASASPSPSASASASKSADTATPSPTATSGAKDSADGSSSDSGSDEKATPSPSKSTSTGSGTSGSGGTATPAPSASTGGGLLGAVGDTLGGILGGGDSGSTASASPSPSASASAGSGSLTDTVKDTVDKTTKTVGDTVKDTTDTASKAVEDTTKTVQDTTEELQKTTDSVASALPSPSASGTNADDCPVATDETGGVDNEVPVADDPWYLNASSLLLKGADYQGVVEVKTANGTTKKVLKYVISEGTDIGDLHQTVDDKQSGKTYHVQASKGSTSTIRDGDTVMYTESISGNLFGLVPITFSPDSPPPLNIPLIYFTDVKVTQAAQFGGSLHVPGMHVYTTD
ncbi:hypothetical protein [Streptomyces brasiliensis]|uniref:Membrane-bound hydrophilic protein n=1 Tax=Streptomyces brasiliensis TaxID=1954 RepID=A0A917NXV2_9ACTN|nr:hypothetical protein [Streptomyces brasiliensis]GGJ35818.1 hypothetical protein GCM10010121_053810 [Streptomyces brasiliensis]